MEAEGIHFNPAYFIDTETGEKALRVEFDEVAEEWKVEQIFSILPTVP